MRGVVRRDAWAGAALSLFSFAGPCVAQTAWQPSPGHTQVPIWPNVVPDAQPVEGPEVFGTVVDAVGSPKLVAGRPWVYVDRVSQPTMTVYSPKGSNTGAAVVVFPGGGYNVLAIDLEGTEACDWLTSKGITCVLLKYRVPCMKSGSYRDCLTALEDAQRTVGLVRFHAAEWHIDPHRIGVLGFSAGGHMVAAMSTHFEKRLYAAVDAADKESCRPDFAVALYPGHLAVPETGCWSSRRNACVCEGRACVCAAPHGVSNHGMASARRDVARNDRDDFEVGAQERPGQFRILYQASCEVPRCLSSTACIRPALGSSGHERDASCAP